MLLGPLQSLDKTAVFLRRALHDLRYVELQDCGQAVESTGLAERGAGFPTLDEPQRLAPDNGTPGTPLPPQPELPPPGLDPAPEVSGLSLGIFCPLSYPCPPLRRLRTGAAFSSRSLLSNPVISGPVFCPFGFEGKASRAFLRDPVC